MTLRSARELRMRMRVVGITLTSLAALAFALAIPGCAAAQPGGDSPRRAASIAASEELKAGGATIQVDFAEGSLDLPHFDSQAPLADIRDAIMRHE